MKISAKLTVAFILISLVSLTAIGSLSYFTVKKYLTQQILNQLQSVASMQKNRIKAIIVQNLERSVFVSSYFEGDAERSASGTKIDYRL